MHDGLVPVQVGVQVANGSASDGEQAARQPFQQHQVTPYSLPDVAVLQPG